MVCMVSALIGVGEVVSGGHSERRPRAGMTDNAHFQLLKAK